MAQKNTQNTESNIEFVFGKSNYRLLLISIAVVLAGFLLMTGETDIYDLRKTVIAPIVVLSGFAIGFIAILKKPGQNK